MGSTLNLANLMKLLADPIGKDRQIRLESSFVIHNRTATFRYKFKHVIILDLQCFHPYSGRDHHVHGRISFNSGTARQSFSGTLLFC